MAGNAEANDDVLVKVIQDFICNSVNWAICSINTHYLQVNFIQIRVDWWLLSLKTTRINVSIRRSPGFGPYQFVCYSQFDLLRGLETLCTPGPLWASVSPLSDGDSTYFTALLEELNCCLLCSCIMPLTDQVVQKRQAFFFLSVNLGSFVSQSICYFSFSKLRRWWLISKTVH